MPHLPSKEYLLQAEVGMAVPVVEADVDDPVDVGTVPPATSCHPPFLLSGALALYPTFRRAFSLQHSLQQTCDTRTSQSHTPIKMCATAADSMWKIGTRVPPAIVRKRATSRGSLAPITWSMSVRTTPSARRPCTRRCTQAPFDGVGW